MAKYHHTPELHSAKGKYPTYRQLTVLETTRPSPVKNPSMGINYTPVTLEPCLVLRGKWLLQAGFTIGQKVTLVVNPEEILILPKKQE